MIYYRLLKKSFKYLVVLSDWIKDFFGDIFNGKQGLGAAVKFTVFGILKRGCKVLTKVAQSTKTEMLMPLITRKIAPESIVYTDCYRSYNALDVSDFYHKRLSHSAMVATGKNHINGFESFLNQAKYLLWKYNVSSKRSLPHLHKRYAFIFDYVHPKQHLKNTR